ncbi:MAG: 3-dehydroquinate dehydratase [Spirochaetes bacterium GWD1_61_31]|nr:MAG: 3-dehydroquinate dehydratase [Spirochaetes bacterium GWB1_60_80]OHD32572.1 MAG: 3-dehydroquinate dehydratase [Spirochaetes bacterium GWC1_61_12]OHD34800.1 MAG: 3-dehydroquinate dehydratase [Spirochaetes bacterium GWD1_61_31]OHD44565.1 MAG: 3-dehydroquinate dehydratase [Spirochaetes bacterium GWE1_60_18]OHD58647.1 MAG: 3-dehydroquinate dehydratase [Spirochaetes bacterium GWF1_60_12]HAP43222.1 3-dehydroquinate dehydratase [Spirochaetaceae bacterium]
MLEFSGISKSYAKSPVKAVDGLELRVADGEIFGFLGPNGAGKTTTIKLLTGVLRPDAGRMDIDGIDIAAEPLRAKRRFGYVSDNPELFARLKAYEYLNFVADVFGVSSLDRQQRIDHYAGLFEIKDVLHGSIGSFSHGMKQKLLVIASLLHDPANWILDEPMVGLDPKSAFALKEIMRQRSRDGKLVFFSTHVMEVAEKLCDRIGIINKGRLIFSGSVAELRAAQGADSSLEKLFLELVDDEAEAQP